jgi:hypothetical protein
MGIIVIAVSVPGLLDLIRARLRARKEVEKVAVA